MHFDRTTRMRIRVRSSTAIHLGALAKPIISMGRMICRANDSVRARVVLILFAELILVWAGLTGNASAGDFVAADRTPWAYFNKNDTNPQPCFTDDTATAQWILSRYLPPTGSWCSTNFSDWAAPWPDTANLTSWYSRCVPPSISQFYGHAEERLMHFNGSSGGNPCAPVSGPYNASGTTRQTFFFCDNSHTITTAPEAGGSSIAVCQSLPTLFEPKKQPRHACSDEGGTLCGDPIDIATGNNILSEVDYVGAGVFPLRFERIYNSQSSTPSHVGAGWLHSYSHKLEIKPLTSISTYVIAWRSDGHAVTFQNFQGSSVGAWHQDSDSVERFNGTSFTDENDNVETYDTSGKLQSVRNRAGAIQTLSYDVTGQLISVTDPDGRQLTFAYNPDGSLATMTDPAGGVYAYGYDGAGNLSSVTYPDSTVRTYIYNEAANTSGANFPSALTGILDESAQRFATFQYDTQERAILSQHSGGADATSVSYNTDGTSTLTDASGTSRTIAFTTLFGVKKISSVSGTACAGCGFKSSYQYSSSNGSLSSTTDFRGIQTQYGYTTDGRLLPNYRAEAANSTIARQVSTTWNAGFRLPASNVESNRTTSFTYDASGNALTRTVTDTSVSPNVSRTWTYTYDSVGRVLTANGPRTDVADVTTYAYYSCTTGYQCGRVHTVTNAAGQVTTYNTYNAYGQPLTITAPNGVVTTLTYDARQRLTSRQTASETTAFDYWPTGLLKKVTLPDASYLFYTYDTAHRLTQVSDALGNAIDYTLDARGNRTAENSYDPANALHRTHTRVFNALNELYQDVNAAGTAAVTTTFGYDNNGNQTSIAAPLSRATSNTYDELNRLKQITDPASGLTRFGYDANDNLTLVTDPRNLTTSYTYTGFGDLKTQMSPDTGTTVNTYDSGGNLSTSTDARGAISTYTYDALNRVTSVAYSLSGTTDQTISFAYDSGTNGLGHLTGASDANHSLGWTYDALGRVTNKSQTIGSVTKAVGYGYSNGNLTSLVTPSGQSIAYGYNANHQITSVSVNGTTVLNSVTYEPLGPTSGWTWGNGTTTARTYDADGKISQIVSSGTKTYSYDDAFRITGITDTSTGAASWTYGYDSLDRITSGVSSSIIRGWTYDANGNRRTETGTAASTYTVSTTNNRITGITGALARTYSYDAVGNTTSYSTVAATYNDAGRLKTLTQGGTTETAVYNALGQRIKISGGTAGTVLYAYDEAGHLLGEYDGTGALIEETVWLGDIPVATLRPNGATVAIYYIHSDQLNTPRQVTRPSDNAQMWTWFSDPFGTDAANANPSGAGTFAYNLRFPGQVFDVQAGLHYNHFRDYDPATGRYVENDPIGQQGGLNTYAYVGGDPADAIDPWGLFKVVVPDICAGQPTFAASVACLSGPNNKLLRQRAQELEALGNRLQNAINATPSCGCKAKLQQLFDNWIVRPSIENSPGGDAEASTRMTWSNGQVVGGDSTFFNEAWLFAPLANGILTPFLHEFSHMTPPVSSVPSDPLLSEQDPNEIATRHYEAMLERALLGRLPLCH